MGGGAVSMKSLGVGVSSAHRMEFDDQKYMRLSVGVGVDSVLWFRKKSAKDYVAVWSNEMYNTLEDAYDGWVEAGGEEDPKRGAVLGMLTYIKRSEMENGVNDDANPGRVFCLCIVCGSSWFVSGDSNNESHFGNCAADALKKAFAGEFDALEVNGGQ